jgi:hypothetical protein
MTKRRSKATEPFHSLFVEGEVKPGSVHDLPDEQAEGVPLIWPDDLWELVDPPAPQPEAAPAPEGEIN